MTKKYKVMYETMTEINDHQYTEQVKAFVTEQKTVFIEIEDKDYIDAVLDDLEKSKINSETSNYGFYDNEEYQVYIDVRVLKVEEID